MSTVERIGPSPHIAVEHDGAGTVVMFLHGIGGRRYNFADQIPAFAVDHHAVAWDARGYGDSDDYDGPLDFNDFSRDVVRVLGRFRCRRRIGIHASGYATGRHTG